MIKSLLVFGFLLLGLGEVFAQNPIPNAPIGDQATGGLMSLWGPFLGVLTALVLFFDRLAKVIPNHTTNVILQVILKISTILGVKVQDKQ